MQGNGLVRIGMNFNEIAEYVQKNRYDFVAISSNFTPQTKMAFKTAEAIKEKNNEIKIFGDGKQKRNYIFSEDITKIIYQLMLDERSVNNIFNLGSDKNFRVVFVESQLL